MNLDKPKEPDSEFSKAERYAAVLEDLYHFLEEKTDLVNSKTSSLMDSYTTSTEHHIYLGILQNIHTFNKLRIRLLEEN